MTGGSQEWTGESWERFQPRCLARHLSRM